MEPAVSEARRTPKKITAVVGLPGFHFVLGDEMDERRPSMVEELQPTKL